MTAARILEQWRPVSTWRSRLMEFPRLYLAGDIPNTFGSDVSTAWQVGRFMPNLGSRRLVAADDYRNTTSAIRVAASISSARPVATRRSSTHPQRRVPRRSAARARRHPVRRTRSAMTAAGRAGHDARFADSAPRNRFRATRRAGFTDARDQDRMTGYADGTLVHVLSGPVRLRIRRRVAIRETSGCTAPNAAARRSMPDLSHARLG